MKRLLSVVLIALLCLFSVMASAADGKVFPIGHEIYKLFDTLFVSAGQVQPSASRPWTAAEARNELAKLNVGTLDENQKALYRKLEEGDADA